MKNLKLLFTILAIAAFSSCQNDPTPSAQFPPNDELVVVKENLSLVVNLCGIYCPPCGGWAWIAFEEMMTNSEGEALPMMIYGSNPFNKSDGILNSKTGTIIEKYLPLVSWPTFAVNQEVKYARDGGSVNAVKEKEMVYSAIEDHRSAEVIAGAALNYWVIDDELKFRYKMELYNPADSGHYRLAVYLIEDGIKEYQAGYSDPTNAIHPVVLREGSDGPWGTAWGIPFENPEQNNYSMKGYGSIPLEEDWNPENFMVYAVIYHADNLSLAANKKISFVNAAEGKLIVP